MAQDNRQQPGQPSEWAINLAKQLTGSNTPAPKQNRSAMGDLGSSIIAGGQTTAATAVPGIMDVGFGLTHGALSKVGEMAGAAPTSRFTEAKDFLFNRPASRLTTAIGEATGFQPSRWADERRAGYTPETQAASQAVDQAVARAKSENSGAVGQFGAALGALATNPRALIPLAGENVAPMAAIMATAGGGAAAAAGQTARIGGLGRAALLEGGISAGQNMSSTDKSIDPGRAAVAAGLSGLAVSAITFGSGRLANRLGFGDVETVLSGGNRVAGQQATRKGILARVAGGMFTEGVLEEMPQSAIESMLGNWAAGKPLMDGVGQAAAEGMVAGALFGGPFGIFDGKGKTPKTVKPEDDAGKPAGSVFNINNHPTNKLLSWYKTLDKGARALETQPELHKRAVDKMDQIKRTLERRGVPAEIVEKEAAKEKFYDIYLATEAATATLESSEDPQERQAAVEMQAKGVDQMAVMAGQYPELQQEAYKRHATDLADTLQKKYAKLNEKSTPEEVAAVQEIADTLETVLGKVPDFTLDAGEAVAAPPVEAATVAAAGAPQTAVATPVATQVAAQTPTSADNTVESSELPNVLPGYDPKAAVTPEPAGVTGTAEAPAAPAVQASEAPAVPGDVTTTEQAVGDVTAPPAPAPEQTAPATEQAAPTVISANPQVAALLKKAQKTAAPGKKQKTAKAAPAPAASVAAPPAVVDPDVQSVLDYADQFGSDPDLQQRIREEMTGKKGQRVLGGKQKKTPAARLNRLRKMSPVDFMKEGATALAIDVNDADFHRITYEIVLKERQAELQQYQLVNTEDSGVQLVTKYDPITDPTEQWLIINSVLQLDVPPEKRAKWATRLGEYLKQALIKNREDPLTATVQQLFVDEGIEGERKLIRRQTVMESILLGKKKLLEEVAARRGLDSLEQAEQLVGPWFAKLGVTPEDMRWIDKKIQEAQGAGDLDLAGIYKAQKKLIRELKMYEHATAQESVGFVQGKIPNGGFSNTWLAQASMYESGVDNTTNKVSAFLTSMKGARNLTQAELSVVFGKNIDAQSARELADLDQEVADLSAELEQAQMTAESLERQQEKLPATIAKLEADGRLGQLRDAWDAVASNVSIESDAQVPVVGFDAVLENGQALNRWIALTSKPESIKEAAAALMATNQQLLAEDTEADVEHLSIEQAIDRVLRETYNGIVTFGPQDRMMTGEEIDDYITTKQFEARNVEIRYQAAVERYEAFRNTLFDTEAKARIAADNQGGEIPRQRTQSTLAAPAEPQVESPTLLGNTEAGQVLGQLKAQMTAPSPMIGVLETMRANETYYKWVPNTEPSAAGPSGGSAYSMVGADEKIYTINKYGNEWKIFQTKSPDGVPSSIDADEWVATVPRQNPNKAQDGTSAKEVIIKVSSDEVAAVVSDPIRAVYGPFEVGNPNSKVGDPAIAKMLQNPDYYAQNEDTKIEVTEMATSEFISRALLHRGLIPKKLSKKALGLKIWELSQSPKYKAAVDALVERYNRGERTTAPAINYRANDIDGLVRALAAAHPSVALKTIPVVEVYRNGAKKLTKIEQKAQAANKVTVETAPTPVKPDKPVKAQKIKPITNPALQKQKLENIRNKRREVAAAARGVRNFPGKTSLGNAEAVNADEFATEIARDPEGYMAASGNKVWLARLTPQQVLDSLDGTQDMSTMNEYFDGGSAEDLEQHIAGIAADMNNKGSRTTYAIPWVNMKDNTSSGRMIAQAARQAGQQTLRVLVIADPTMQENIDQNPDAAAYEVLASPEMLPPLESGKPRTTVALNQYVTEATTVAEIWDAVRRFMPGVNTEKDIIILRSFAHLPLVLDMTDLILPSDVPGFFLDGKVYLIADNINVGEEISTLMHEVGVHAGMDDATRTYLAGVIKQMINSGSEIESRLATQASNNVASSILTLEMNGHDATEADADNELVAYFVQFAVESGINPTRMETVPTAGLKAFFTRVMAWVRKAWRSVMGRSDLPYNAQDIVDMAFAAAQTAFREPMGPDEYQAKVFSRARAEGVLDKRVYAQMPQEAQYRANTFKKFARTSKDFWSFTTDFVDMVENFFNPDPITGISPVRAYFDTVFRRAAERGRLESLIQHAVDETATWRRKDRDEVNSFMLDSTTQEEWGFVPDWENAVEPENLNDELVARFNAMNPSQRSVVRRVFKLADQLYADEQAALREEIVRSYQGQLTRAEANPEVRLATQQEMAADLAEFDTRVGNRKAAWLPLKRFGEHAVTWISTELRDAMSDGATKVVRQLKQDPRHYHVSFFENHVEAQRAEAELSNKYFGKSGKVEMFDRQSMLSKPELIPFNFMNTWKQQLESQEVLDAQGRVTNTTASGLAKSLTKMYISQLSETSIRKSELNRLNVEGADNDMLRAFVTHGRGMAAMISAIKMNKETLATLQDLKDQAKEGDNLATRERRTEVVNEIIERHATMLDYAPDGLQQKVMGFTSVWMLLMSPAYYMQNATQPWMLTLPVLGAEFGVAKAGKALGNAYKDVHNIWNKGLSGELADLSRHPNAAERQMLEALRDLGSLDVGMSSDLGSFEGPKSRGMAWVNARHQNMIHAVRTVEIFNRGATALASYRLARAAGQTHEQASNYAKKQVQVTQGDYSGINAPRILSSMGGWTKVMFQFRKFQLIQIGLLVRSIANITRTQGAAEKLVASKQLAYLLSTHGLVGGAMGLPMANIIGWAAAMVAGGDDDPKDAELLARKAIGNKQIADLVLKGLPAMAGIDMSGRLGMGQTFSIMPFVEMEFSRDGYAAMFTQLMGGPSAALGMSIWDATGMMFNNNFQLGFAQMMPRGLRDMMRAGVYATRGVTRRNATQDTAISADDLSWFDLGGQFLGWPTKALTDRQNVNRWLTDTEKHFGERVSALQYDYVNAKTSAEKMRVRQEFLKLQQTRREYGFKTQKMTTLTDAPKNKRKREGDTVQGVPVRNSNREFVGRLLN